VEKWQCNEVQHCIFGRFVQSWDHFLEAQCCCSWIDNGKSRGGVEEEGRHFGDDFFCAAWTEPAIKDRQNQPCVALCELRDISPFWYKSADPSCIWPSANTSMNIKSFPNIPIKSIAVESTYNVMMRGHFVLIIVGVMRHGQCFISFIGGMFLNDTV
jgi:hypothetical protein